MLKHIVPKFHPDLSARLKDIAEKQVLAKLKPIETPQGTAIAGNFVFVDVSVFVKFIL